MYETVLDYYLADAGDASFPGSYNFPPLPYQVIHTWGLICAIFCCFYGHLFDHCVGILVSNNFCT